MTDLQTFRESLSSLPRGTAQGGQTAGYTSAYL